MVNITSLLFEAFIQCPTKAFRLAAEPESPSDSGTYVCRSTASLAAFKKKCHAFLLNNPTALRKANTTKSKTSLLVISDFLGISASSSDALVLTTVGAGKKVEQCTPVKFIQRAHVLKQEKVSAAFDAIYFANFYNVEPKTAALMYGDHTNVAIFDIEPFVADVEKTIADAILLIEKKETA